MKLETSLAMVGLLAGGVLAGACGGSGGASPADGGGGNSGGSPNGTLVWKDDGTQRSAQFATAALVHTATQELLEVAGATAGGFSVAFGVTVAPPLTPNTYSCGSAAGGAVVSFQYMTSTATLDPVPQGCSITLTTVGTAAGDHAVGTFSATLTVAPSGTKQITAGMFDLAMTAN